VVNFDWQSIFSGILELALLAGAIFYITLVLLSYFDDRTHARPSFDLHDPALSCERLAVWLGVIALALAIRVVSPIYAMLSEASAEVGEWVLSRRHHESH